MKADAYQVITDRVCGLLEQGIIPWEKPWNGGDTAPKNLISRKEYRGVNVFLLGAQRYASPYWLTYKQATELGGHVRKGERATPIIFWTWLDYEPKGGTIRIDDNGKPVKERVPMLRYYSGFNVCQCDDIPADKIPAVNGDSRQHDPIDAAEQIVAAMPKRPEIRDGNARAYYSPAGDYIGMPKPEAFRTGEEYYSTLFHELTHSTGHKDRLNRKGVSGSDGEWSAFGSAPYAREELVAEMGAAFLCGQAGIVERTVQNSAAYIQGWLGKLRDDRKLVVTAAAQAQKAADFILDRHFSTEGGEQ